MAESGGAASTHSPLPDRKVVVVTTAFAVIVLAATVLAATVFYVAGNRFGALAHLSAASALVAQFVAQFVDKVAAFAGAAGARVPALAMGMLAIAALIPVAAIAALARRFAAGNGGLGHATKHRTAPSGDDCTGFACPRRAWLAGPSACHDISAPLLRIGRENDNDLVIDRPGIERYHAAVERTPEHDFYISDLARRGKGSVLVNGRVTRRRRLRDGDVVVLGRETLEFHTAER